MGSATAIKRVPNIANACLLFVLAGNQMVSASTQHRTHDRGEPKQPQLRHGPVPHKQSQTGASGGVDRGIRHRDTAQVDQRQGQGRVPVSGHQVPVRTSQGALTGLGQEHQTVTGDVCAGEFVDGASANIAGGAGMSAPAGWAKARTEASLSPKTWELAANRTLVSAYEHHASARALAGVVQTILRS